MPDVHIPKLDERDEEERKDDAVPKAPIAAHRARGKSIAKLALEVVLIGTGVFLGLAGEQWRENARHREMAEASLRRFRAEAAANRAAVAKVKDYHADRLKSLRPYLAALRRHEPVPQFHLEGLQPALFERTAWDLALATQALAYIDSDLAFAISRAYNTQESLAGLSRAILQAMYIKTPGENLQAFLEAVEVYYGDVTLIEPELMKQYDELLPRLDRAVGETHDAK